MSYLGTLSLVLITTALAGHFSRRVGMPAVIGELLVGIVLGPAVLGLVTNNSFVHTFSEIGVIILMFIAGLESDLELLKACIFRCGLRSHRSRRSGLPVWEALFLFK